MKLQPFTAVDDVPFSSSWKEVVFSHGKPLMEGRNGGGLNELDYGDVVFRFEDSGRLEEVSAQSPVLYLDNIAVPFSSLAHFVRTNDPSSFERDGFLISPQFGLAFEPDNPNWVTALAEHCLDEWRDS